MVLASKGLFEGRVFLFVHPQQFVVVVGYALSAVGNPIAQLQRDGFGVTRDAWVGVGVTL